MKNIEYNIKTEIVDNLPFIENTLIYRDEFTDDHYVLRSQINENVQTSNIPFEIIKNGKRVGKLNLTEREVKLFFETFFKDAEDYDFEQEFRENNLLKFFSNEIEDFLKRYDEVVIPTQLTMEGEIKRMQRIAGLL